MDPVLGRVAVELEQHVQIVPGVINTHFIVAHMIARHGTEAQRAHYLPKMATGEIRGSFSMSEPDLGSDVAAIKTRAARTDDGYVIDGAKMWLTNGATANLTAVLVKTDLGEEKPHRNLTTFLKDSGERNDVVAGMAKLIASEYCAEVTQRAFRNHGGFGYSKDAEIERLMREAPFLLIGEGTSEIQKTIISKGLLREYRL